MSESIAAPYTIDLTVRETLSAAEQPSVSRRVITHNAYNNSGTLNSASTPPVTKAACKTAALVAGTLTLDLTAIPHDGEPAAVDATGLKVQALLIRVPTANANPLIIEPGAAAPYNLFGATFKLTLYPGDVLALVKRKDASMPDVAVGAKNIKFTDGAAGTETFEYEFVFG